MSPRVHPTAIVHDDAELGDDVSVGPFTVIEAGVRIGANSYIGSHCLIGHTEPDTEAGPLTVGSGTVIRSHSVIYSGSTFGDGLETGHYVAIRERTAAGRNLRVGTGSDLHGDLTIGDYARIHSGVQVHKHSRLHDFVWLFPNVTLTNDPHPPSDIAELGCVVEEFASVCADSLILPGITVGRDAVVAAGSLVTRDVPEGMLVRGRPTTVLGPTSMMKLRDGSDFPANHWRN